MTHKTISIHIGYETLVLKHLPVDNSVAQVRGLAY